MEKKTVLENLDLVLLAMDETVDGGCAFSTLSVCARQPNNVTACGLLFVTARYAKHNFCGRLILETDPSTIASRVAMRGADTDVPLTEQVHTYIRL